MKHPKTLRLALVRSLIGSALLASPLLAITPAEFDSLRAKADRGNSIAQYNLGLAHADRREAIYDPAQAYAWLSLAAANGTNGKALSQLTSLLTPEQLAEGKRRLAILTASPISPATEAASPIVSSVTAAPAPVAPVVEVDADQKKLSAELSAAWKENELLKAGLTAQLADANKRVAIAEAALASKDKEISSLQSRLTEAAATPAVAPAPAAPIGVSAELASLRTERDQLQASATAALSQLTELRSQNAKVGAEENALREKLTRAASDLATARRAQAQAEAESASLKAAADRASAERLAVAAQLETVTTELAAAKASTPSADSTAKAEQARLGENLKTLERQHTEVAAQLEQANSQNALIRTQYTKLLADAQTAAKTSANESVQLRGQLAATEEKLAKASAEGSKSVVLKADPRVAALETERASLLLRLAEAQAAATAVPAPTPAAPAVTFAPVTAPAVDTETATKLTALEKAKAETDDKLAAALRSFTLQQAEIDRLQKSLASIDAERAATATQLESATTELATLRPQAASAASVSTDAESLRTQLAAAKQTIADQSASLTTSNRSLTDARQTVDAATADLVATRDQLRQTQAQSAAFAVENQQLKTKLALTGSLAASSAPSRPGTIPSISVNLPAATVAPATPPPAPAAPAVVATPAAPRVHTVSSGDSLSKISKQYYGTANRWNDILQANKDVIRNPDALVLGTKLRIP
ncbi:MAG TPA: LysM peptidoglycan-binding domain-containing protein [Rariglobus sp.]|nr:LysM peptidoglycan-binding domain-containing protein [Rariglobus sp.]